MATKAVIRKHIMHIANTLSSRGGVMNAGRLRKIVGRLGRTYKTNWGLFKIIRAAHYEASKRGDLATARNIQYAFVRDNGQYAWDRLTT